MKPLIGLTTYQSRNAEGLPASSLLQAYSEAILSVGGLPVLIPLSFTTWRTELVDLIDRLDGMLFTGGGDIDPNLYAGVGDERLSGVDPGRDALELELFKRTIDLKKPILGICRGIQLINVALGGTLYTDLSLHRPGSIRHDYYPDWPRTHLAHGVTVLREERLFQIVHEEVLTVNSLHHQGVRSLAPGLRPLGTAEDGSVEAVELVDHPFCLGVQWHPEWLLDQNASREIFGALVAAAGEQHA